MNKSSFLLAAVGLAGIAAAQGTVSISIGVREVGAAGQPFTTIGGDGGTLGGIEWINRDAQTLVLDGTWQRFTFNFATDPILGFAGTTANSVLDGDYGVLEHIRVLNSGGVTGPIDLWVDDVENTIVTGGGPVSTVFGDFQGYGDNDEVLFQEPTFSGSTSGNVLPGGTSGVDNYVASRSNSCQFRTEFVDGTTTRWVRLTTFQARNQPNPLVRFDQGSTISFWMRGGTGQQNLGSQGPGNVISEMVGIGLNAGEVSTYFVAGAPSQALGVVFFSLTGGIDIPVFGGTLVSFSGNLFGAPFPANVQGRASLVLPGDPAFVDLVLQSAYFDGTAPFGVAISNAVQAGYGR